MTDRIPASVEDVKMQIQMFGSDYSEDFSVLSTEQIEWFIDNYATLIVDEELTGSEMSDKRLRMIESCLAGHAILSSGIDEVRQVTSEMLSDNSQNAYTGDYGSGLSSTSLGQKAIELDTTGILHRMDDPDSVAFWHVTLQE